MERRPMTDQEVYPALWAALAVGLAAYLLWRYGLGAPPIGGCWIWSHWQVYCPGCGGTRAVTALARGDVLTALYYHPAVPVTAGITGVYLATQTVWRLRGRRGRVLRYDPRWLGLLVGLLLGNWAVRNILWLGFGIGL